MKQVKNNIRHGSVLLEKGTKKRNQKCFTGIRAEKLLQKSFAGRLGRKPKTEIFCWQIKPKIRSSNLLLQQGTENAGKGLQVFPAEASFSV